MRCTRKNNISVCKKRACEVAEVRSAWLSKKDAGRGEGTLHTSPRFDLRCYRVPTMQTIEKRDIGAKDADKACARKIDFWRECCTEIFRSKRGCLE